MITRLRRLSLFVLLSLFSCQNTEDGTITPDLPDSAEIKVTASLDSSTIPFEDEEVSACLNNVWKEGASVIGLVRGRSVVTFTVKSVDPQTGEADLCKATGASMAVGDKVYCIFCPGKTSADLSNYSMKVDFSEQSKDVIPILLLAEGKVSDNMELNVVFRNAVSIICIKQPEVGTLSNREINSVIISGPKVASSGTVCIENSRMVLRADAPSKFVVKHVQNVITRGSVSEPLYLALPSCKIDKITIQAGAYNYCWTSDISLDNSKLCCVDGKKFNPVSNAPTGSGIEEGGVEWAINNFNISQSDDYGDAVKWGDSKLIYSQKSTGGNFVPSSGYEVGFTDMVGEAYFDGNGFAKYSATDGKKVLDPVDDIIQLSYPGTGWRTPTADEFETLLQSKTIGIEYSTQAASFNHNSCSFQLTRSFKGGKNTQFDQGPMYWTATLDPENPAKAISFKIGAGAITRKSSARALGLAIHPVRSTGGKGGSYQREEELPNLNKGKSILSFPGWQQISINYGNLTASNHPRILLRNNDINNIVNAVESGSNSYLSKMHRAVLASAEGMSRQSYYNKPLVYELDASGRRLLQVSRDALRWISTLAYAYRCTEDEKYLRMAEFTIKTVCSFPDWHPSHFLDVAEMAAGVAIGYDWLYQDLSDEVRALAADRLKRFAVDEALSAGVYNRKGNWNQVCCGGVTMAALAIYEDYPSACDELTRRCLAANAKEVKQIYSPRGAHPEGPGYWEYGTTYQGLYNLTLDSVLGTDFKLPEIEGFSYAGEYYSFIRDNCGKRFNYSDSSSKDEASYGMWYMAYILNNSAYLYHDLYALDTSNYGKEDYTILSIACSYKLGNNTPTAPSGRIYSSGGANPILICRTGWEYGDTYLALKAGSGTCGHAHLDVGEIVFESDGVRWFKDPDGPMSYTDVENMWKAMGLGDNDPTGREENSWRWQVFQNQNRQHSTLTVNGHNQYPTGKGEISDIIDTDSRIGGTADMTSAYSKDLISATRSAAIVDGVSLEVRDKLQLYSANAHIRWTCVSDAEPRIVSDGIILTSGNVSMKLTTDAPSPVFMTWSADPSDYSSPITVEQKPLEGYICGFEFDLPASCSTEIVTKLQKFTD